ncbi:spectrin beta chain, non-erythrocytic 5 isoform X2 [Drosophila guanche]|uniref:Blast:Spectrin beta chain, non-erythrocytic 5 n=1 Tax=Drosophila guanche TaxID=7266 RepID=A0A3B0K3F9_DROGU|nr:spectrin beta chain, non-erythrocytic 5 isoform X2 [Drosophila guanche]SPP87212.1 blast:Spectrin beta chain%2C non-erythrocytic 5 [Drosophila guanche]
MEESNAQYRSNFTRNEYRRYISYERQSLASQYEPGGYATLQTSSSSATSTNRGTGNMTQRDGIIKFENERIKTLQEERLHIQKKTFTKWMNSFLIKAKMEVEDLFTDLADGIKLLKLLEIISSEKLGKPNSGRMRVHKIENVNKSLAFLHTKVRLESIGAEDIVDGNPRLILGLIWTIILRFQIQEIEIDVDEENESSEKRSAKDALLLWCQRKTHGYAGVNITDFTSSWRSGLGFNALIHSHRPDLFEYNTIVNSKNSNLDNLNHAFDTAANELGIPSLLDAEDIDSARPDEKSILTYVASYYHTFARMKNEQKSGKRIANIVGQLMDADRKKIHYERLTTNLLSWIRQKTLELEQRNLPNSLEGIQRELMAFKEYRTIEKPPKYKERSEIEALYFTINTLLKALNQPPYNPHDGVMVNDIEKAWQILEYAEHNREVALREELLRQEKLEQLNYKFEKKSVLREGYLKEMIQVLSDPRYLRQVDATLKKHEAISADILARVERFNDLTAMANELEKENYHGKERVKKREQEVMEKWRKLLELLENQRLNLSQMSNLMNLLREIASTTESVRELQQQFASEDVGPHLLGVEELLQAHSLQELQVNTYGETLKRFNRQAAPYKSSEHKDAAVLAQRLGELEEAYSELIRRSADRRARLEEARNFHHFMEDYDNEESWLVDKQRICKTGITAKDLRAVLSLQQKHKALEDEIKSRKPKSSQMSDAGKRLIGEKHPRSSEIKSRIDSLAEHWQALEALVEVRRRQLEDAAEAYQFYTDANEAESWLNEKMALVNSKDYGNDEPSAQALLQRHRDLQGELNAYSGDILNLNQQADKLIKAGICTLELTAAEPELPDVEQEEWINETRLVPKEVWEDEWVEKLEHKKVTETKMLPHVRSQFPFEGQGMKMEKGEVMLLKSKTNDDWWCVRKDNGVEGFVPANYVREIEPRPVACIVPKAEKVKSLQKVKKTILVRQVVPVKRIKPVSVTPKPLVQRRTSTQSINENADSVEKRQQRINATYDELQEMAQKRHALLEDSIHLFGFYRECDDFEKWMKEKERMIKSDDGEGVDNAKRKFEKFITDLSAASKRVEEIDGAVDTFRQQGHSQLDKIIARQRQIHQIWQRLNNAKAQREKSLEGASSVELFNRTCDEAKVWMSEKMLQLDTAVITPDLRTVQALQRRHQNLERELAPVEDKVNRVTYLGNSVKNAYPAERDNVNGRQQEVQDMWQQVQQRGNDLRNRIESEVGQQIFNNSAKTLLAWIDSVKDQLNADESARDVETANNLLKKHNDLGDDIRAHDTEFVEVIQLGKQLSDGKPDMAETVTLIERLKAEQDAIHRGWAEKQKWLLQCVELQMFNREADKIDATTKSHEAFLEYNNLGASLDEVEAILKRHLDFEKTLMAQDKILKGFSDNADKLIANDHYDAKYIGDRRNQVLGKRKAVKDRAFERKRLLQASKDYNKFAAEADDLKVWLQDKTRIAGDENYRDLSNLPRKLQKHKAFERELRANEGQLRNVNKDGEDLIQAGNRVPEVEFRVADLNKKWKDLLTLSEDKGRKLEQAASQREHNRALEDAKKKVDELDGALKSKDVGNDLRSCKDLINKQQILESEITIWDQKVAELVSTGDDMAHEGHFNAQNIEDETKELQQRFKDLRDPTQQRRDKLEESLNFHKFVFELDAEFQWINDHLPAAKSNELGQNLHQTQSLYKKHKKLEAEIKGHRSMINKALQAGQSLVSQQHPESENVAALCKQLEAAWQDLEQHCNERSRKLDMSLKAQQYLFDAGEIESWLGERNNALRSTEYGRDRDSAAKLLTKHKTIELELDTYSGIVTEMGHSCAAMVAAGHPDSKVLTAKQQLIEKMLKSLHKLASQRQGRLMESLYKHEYFLESDEVEQWIREQEQTASSEDYGQDFEHLQLLQNKFDDLKHRVEVGADRVDQCELLAKKLIDTESPYANEVEKRQEQLRTSWENLLQLLNQREQKLHAAGEIHRFHRDVAEALFRIQDKNAALSNELGKDLNSALALLRKHEGFENDLVALEAQLQVLVEDSVRLQAKYPSNAVAIAQQQDKVVAAWNDLKERSTARGDRLAASSDLQTFLTDVRDIVSWSSNLRAALQAEEHVSDAAGATALKIQHDAIYGEIEAREDKFRYLNELSDSMVQTGHYAAADVEEKCAAMLDERQKLHAAWNKKKIMLEQKIDLFCFLRDAKQIDNLSSSQQAALSSSDFGQTVEDVQNQIKKHDEFERLIQTQEEKVALLQEHGRKLIEQRHYDSANIQTILQGVLARRQKVKDLCAVRRYKLEDALLYAKFVRDCAEAESWISEKQKKLEADAANYAEVTNLDEKIKKLQKHQAFQAEVAANQGRIKEIQDTGVILLSKQHESSPEIKLAIERVLHAWQGLLAELDQCGRGLEEAQDILEFNNQLDKIEAWIRDKEMMVQASDTGRDLEHCNALMRKLDDVDSDMRVDDQRVKHINQLADKLINQAQLPEDTQSVDKRRRDFNHNWRQLQGALNAYRALLGGANEIHVFNRDVDDTAERIAEKALAMSSADTGRDLAAVEALIRREEALERDMSAVKQKIDQHETAAQFLIGKYPERGAQHIERKLEELHKSWANLQSLSVRRQSVLNEAYLVHKFVSDVRELELWVNDMVKKMNNAQAPSTINDCETQLELHQERKVEIEGRDQAFVGLKQHGEQLSGKQQPSENVKKYLLVLEELHQTLHEAWSERARDLTEAHQLQLFKAQVEQVEMWLANKEAFLNNDDLGDSYTAVERLLKKHDAFEKLLNADHVDTLQKFAQSILESDPKDGDLIREKLAYILRRKQKLLELSEERKQRLLQSLQLQEFLRSLYEIDRWLVQKLQGALDENYREPSNLQSKIQKHATFDAELLSNSPRVQSVIGEGERLIKGEHFAKDEIAQQVQLLEGDWLKLKAASQAKKEKLQQAYEALAFNRSVDEFNNWMDDVELQLSSEDYGKDLATVSNLLKKHERLEADVAHHNDLADQLKLKDERFFQADHFLKHEIHERAMASIKRYNTLHEPIAIRRENLEDSLSLQQFLRDAEDELQWLAEKQLIAGSQDLGSSLLAVQGLQKKHNALEAELTSQEPLIQSLLQRGQQMIRDNHFASEELQYKSELLQKQLLQLRDLAAIRRLRLLDAVESQLFYVEANEADAWMREKRPILASSDYGRDEISVQGHQKKLEVLQRELTSFRPSIDKVNKLATGLVERNHFDSANIQEKNGQVEQQYADLLRLAKERELRLGECKKLFEYLRETEELHEWVGDQMAVTASEDYGEDVEHVEQLMLAFESFVSNLNANESRVVACLERGDRLIQENNPYRNSIKAKRDETKQLWDELKDLVNARQDALAGAKQVHVYDRVADETITLIQEKDASLISEDYGQDLESIQALGRKHLVFESELVGIQGQVESVLAEAVKLGEIYPDAREHIEVKRDEAVEAWTDLKDKTTARKSKLSQAEQLQSYFDEYRDLIAWINEMLAKITAPDLANSVAGAELLLASTKDHDAEICARDETFANFAANGQQLIKEKHFLANEVEDKIKVLHSRHELLKLTLRQRRDIYELNLDTQLFLKDAEILDQWISSREPQLKDAKLGDSIPQVEDLLRRHEDFEKTVAAQEEKFQAIKRITLLEQLFRKQLEQEKISKRQEKERQEKERLEQLKQRELQRLADERRRAEKQQEHRPQQEKTPIFSTPMVTISSSSTAAAGVASGPHSPAVNLRPTFGDENEHMALQKSSSSSMFGDRLRRGSADANVKRAESMKVQPKQPKRTPSFTTRRRAQSFRKNQKGEGFDLPPVEIQGSLERKHGLQSGGKKAPVRSWKQFHTVLCGQLVCFFKDENDFLQQKTATAPVNILGAKCERADDYTKKKYVFRLRLPDGSEFLFEAPSLDILNDWVRKISFHASLPPNLQLLSYDESMKQQSSSSPDIKVSSSMESPVSSRNSSPDSQRRTSSGQTLDVTATPQMAFLQRQMQQQQQQQTSQPSSPTSPTVGGFDQKPPIPPRGAPPVASNRQSQENLVVLRNRQSSSNDLTDGRSATLPAGMSGVQQQQNGNTNNDATGLQRNSEARQSDNPPPLPTTMPPVGGHGHGHAHHQHQHTQHQHQAQVQQRINAFNAAASSNQQQPDFYNNNLTRQQHQHHHMSPQRVPSLGTGRIDSTRKFIEMEAAQQSVNGSPAKRTASYSNSNSNSSSGASSNGNGNVKSTTTTTVCSSSTSTSSRTVWHLTSSSPTSSTKSKSSTGGGSGEPAASSSISNAISNPSYMGWGTTRFESNRPVSLQPDSISFSRASAESSSESEAQSISSVSGVKGSSSSKGTKEERRSGMFRIFGRKGDKEKEKDKRRSSQVPPQ